MRKVQEYLDHARECRGMAFAASPEHKAQLENMAATWEQLAEARRRQLSRHGLTDDDELPPQIQMDTPETGV